MSKKKKDKKDKEGMNSPYGLPQEPYGVSIPIFDADEPKIDLNEE